MKSTFFSHLPRASRAVFCAGWFLLSLCGQSDTQVLTASAAKATGRRGAVMEAVLRIQLKPGYHTNSNKPNEDYLIPIKLSWAPAALETAEIVYPEPQEERYEFADKPMSVYTGNFEILTRFRVPKTAPGGLGSVNGKLRYQACTDKMCLPPKTVDVRLVYTIN